MGRANRGCHKRSPAANNPQTCAGAPTETPPRKQWRASIQPVRNVPVHRYHCGSFRCGEYGQVEDNYPPRAVFLFGLFSEMPNNTIIEVRSWRAHKHACICFVLCEALSPITRPLSSLMFIAERFGTPCRDRKRGVNKPANPTVSALQCSNTPHSTLNRCGRRTSPEPRPGKLRGSIKFPPGLREP